MGVQCLKFTRDGRAMATCGKDGTAKIWDLATRKATATMAGAVKLLYTLDLLARRADAHNGRQRDHGTVLGRDDREAERERLGSHGLGRGRPLLTWTGRQLPSAVGTGTLSSWMPRRAGRGDRCTPRTSANLSLAFSPDGKYLVAGSDKGLLRAWEVSTWKELGMRSSARPLNVRAIAFSPDGKHFATASHDWTVKIWDAPGMSASR